MKLIKALNKFYNKNEFTIDTIMLNIICAGYGFMICLFLVRYCGFFVGGDI